MKHYFEVLWPIVVGGILAMIAYDMFVKGLVSSNFEGRNYEVDQAGNMRKVA